MSDHSISVRRPNISEDATFEMDRIPEATVNVVNQEDIPPGRFTMQ